MMKRMIIMVVGTLAIFGALFGMQWFGTRMMNQAVDSTPIPSATISAAPVQRVRWDNRIEAIGNLIAVNGTEVTTEAGGIVTAIAFESGARIEKGARLLRLDAANEQGEYRRLLAVAELAELNRVRRAKLYRLDALAKADYDAALSEANAARAEAEAQAAKVAQKDIRAPFAGILGLRRINIGDYLSPGTAIVSLQSLDPIDIDFSLPERFTSAVLPGFEVVVAVDAWPGEQFAGRILAIEPQVDPATRNFKVRARLPNPDLKLRAGQFGRVRLTLPGERELLVLPRTAVSYDSYGSSVFVVQKKAAGDTDTTSTDAYQTATAADLEVSQRFVLVGEARGDAMTTAS